MATRLRPYGYEYANIDDSWASSTRATNGSLVANRSQFPNGIAFLADVAHSLDLRLGLYTARGSVTCAKRPGSLGHYEVDAATFANWGVD
jgi:alpha-galactosidase